ncbi:MAG: YkgJ family cysteine cluster protein [Desulfamplus sp.]|nr:YkgJ family cysteine cluster protein [Desulfamplus sp.]
MSEEMIPIGIDEPLLFECSPDVYCFNACCRDLNQFLTPYDILRLKKNLSITSDEFLKQYTSRHNGPETGLPVVTFKSNPDSGHACPFVKESGCSIYPDRPASCRMYPIARAIVRSRQTGEVTEYFALIQEPHCLGFSDKDGYAHRANKNEHSQDSALNKSKLQLTVRDWLKRQDVDMHNFMNDKMMEIISLKNRIIPGKLDGADADKFYLACYNLDTFRSKIFENGQTEKGLLKDLIKNSNISQSLLERIKTDDIALLDFGLAWIKNMLFGIEIKV